MKMSSNRMRAATMLVSLAGFVAVGAVTATQAQAWTVTASVDSSCGKDGNVLLTGVFTNNESTKDINVTMVWTSLSDGPRLVAHQQGGQFQIDTGVTTLPAGDVTFNETWADGSAGSDSTTASFVAADCTPTTPPVTYHPTISFTVDCKLVTSTWIGKGFIPNSTVGFRDDTTTFHSANSFPVDANGNVTIPSQDLQGAYTNGQAYDFKVTDDADVTVYAEQKGIIPAACPKPTGSASKSPHPKASASKSTSHHGGSPSASSSSNAIVPVDNGNSAPGAPIGGTSDGIPAWEYVAAALVLFGAAVMTASRKARELVMTQVRRVLPRGRFAA